MTDHRIRLDDREVQIILAALRARFAGTKSRKLYVETQRLYERLLEGKSGNPDMRLGRPPVVK